MFRSFVACCVLSLGSMGADAALVEIGFDDLQPGSTMPPGHYSSLGVTINLIGLPGVGPQLWGQNVDSDSLGLHGNTLWPSPAPYRVGLDDGPFFDIEFQFSRPVDFFAIIADNAEEPYQIRAFNGDTLLAVAWVQIYKGNNNGAVIDNELGQIGGSQLFDRVVIDLSNGGGLDGPESWDTLRFNTVSVVPTPASLWLFGSALGVMGGLRRKNRGYQRRRSYMLRSTAIALHSHGAGIAPRACPIDRQWQRLSGLLRRCTEHFLAGRCKRREHQPLWPVRNRPGRVHGLGYGVELGRRD